MAGLPLGSPSRPLRVAIIGSGPSAFYAAEALFKVGGLSCRCDVFDRLPTPYGLVRGGVAPDHQKIKAVVKVYETAYEAGVMVRTSGTNVIISPPLVITAADVQRIISALDAGLSAAEGK